MAGGIDWFRWHHGSVTDPKFQLVARRSSASLPEVLAVWTYLLEKASAADFRGCFGEIDSEAVDCLFGLSEGATDAILAAMVDRKLIADEYIVAWEKRQPKREDDTAAERKRRQREREHELSVAACVTGDASRNVTPSHADVTHGHDRGEERREEQREEAPPASRVPPADAGRKPRALKRCPDDFDADPLRAWAAAEAPRADFGRELAKFRDHTFKTAHSDWPAAFRNWLRRASDDAAKRPQSFQDRKAAEGAKWMNPPSTRTEFDFIDMEAADAAPLAIR